MANTTPAKRKWVEMNLQSMFHNQLMTYLQICRRRLGYYLCWCGQEGLDRPRKHHLQRFRFL